MKRSSTLLLEKCKLKLHWGTISHRPERRAIIKKSLQNNTCCRGCWEKGTFQYCWWEYKLVKSLWKAVWRFIKKTKTRVAILLGNPTPGHVSRQNYNSKETCTPLFTAALFTITKTENDLKIHQQWMDKEDVIHTYSGILFSREKEWINAICNNIDGTRDYHTKWSNSERKKQTPHNITYVRSKTVIQMNLSMTKEKTHRHREQTCGCQGRG